MSDDLEALLGPKLARHFAAEARARCSHEVELGRYAAGDLAPEERATFERHLEGCAECRKDLRLFQLEVARDADLVLCRRGPLARLRRLAEGWRRSWTWGLGAGIAAASVALLLTLAREPREDLLTAKGNGGFELAVAAVRDGRTFRVREATNLESGDHLGFFYSAPERGFLMVLDVTPSAIARIVPAQQGESAEVEAASERPLPDGAVLDAGEGCEWVVGLFSLRPFSESQARAWLEPMLAGRSGCNLAPAGSSQVQARTVTVRR